MVKLTYHKGYKYQSTCSVAIQTGIHPAVDIVTEYVSLSHEGKLFIKSGYAWDGASGPAVDTDTWMLPSLVHDALCQLLALNKLSEKWTLAVHEEMYGQCLKAGMNKFRAWYSYQVVKMAYKKEMSRKEEFTVTGG